MGDTKLKRFLPKNQHTLRKLLNFEFGLMASCQKVPKFDFQSQLIFDVKNHPNLSQFFFIEKHRLILMQKIFLIFHPRLKTPQPVLP